MIHYCIRYEEAVPDFEAVVELDWNSVEAHINLGLICQLHLKQYKRFVNIQVLLDSLGLIRPIIKESTLIGLNLDLLRLRVAKSYHQYSISIIKILPPELSDVLPLR